MKQKSLFKEQRPRRSNGRYCTMEQLRVERIENENKRLRLERDKYYRMAMELSETNSLLTRELAAIKMEGKDNG